MGFDFRYENRENYMKAEWVKQIQLGFLEGSFKRVKRSHKYVKLSRFGEFGAGFIYVGGLGESWFCIFVPRKTFKWQKQPCNFVGFDYFANQGFFPSFLFMSIKGCNFDINDQFPIIYDIKGCCLVGNMENGNNKNELIKWLLTLMMRLTSFSMLYLLTICKNIWYQLL